MNKEQWIAGVLGLLGVSGPLANLLVNTFHMSDSAVQPVLSILTILTPLIVGGVYAYLQRNAAKVASVAHMSAEEQHEALNKVPDMAKVLIAEATPGVQTVVVNDNVNGALQQLASSNDHPNIVTESQNEMDAKKGTKTP